MSNRIITPEEQEQAEETVKPKEPSRLTNTVQKIADFDFNLNRDWMVKQIPFAFFVLFLLLLHIYNVHTTERIIRNTDQLNKEVKELHSEYITILSELMSESKQSTVASKLDTLGIKELTTPPIKITY
ncbi:MAG: FtsL-like putative cell division protein [Bacteroidia bacterium]|jgi:cell division protein FtsL|nr:FtsL-like putative cell division protein [Bacteroidia bacterium]